MHNVTEYLGVPFLLELPAMRTDGSGYFGTGENALHVYHKNITKHPGLDIETVNSSDARIGGAEFLVQQYNEQTDAYETLGSIGDSGTISLPTGFIVFVKAKCPRSLEAGVPPRWWGIPHNIGLSVWGF